MLILCLAWRDKGKCLVAKLKSGLAAKLDNVSTKIYTVSVKLWRESDKKCLHLQTMKF